MPKLIFLTKSNVEQDLNRISVPNIVAFYIRFAFLLFIGLLCLRRVVGGWYSDLDWLGICHKQFTMFRGNFSKNRYPHLRISPPPHQKKGPISCDFAPKHTKFSKFLLCELQKFLKIRPIVRNFFMKNETHVKGFLAKKLPFLQHIPICLNM